MSSRQLYALACTALLLAGFTWNLRQDGKRIRQVTAIRYSGVEVGDSLVSIQSQLKSETRFTSKDGLTRVNGRELGVTFGFRKDLCVYIKANSVEGEGVPNGFVLTRGMALNDVKAMLGEPRLEHFFSNGDAVHVYDYKALDLRLEIETIGVRFHSWKIVPRRRVGAYHLSRLSSTMADGYSRLRF
jgi:hypothetical protein